MTTMKSTGRPKSYSVDNVKTAISDLRDRGLELSADNVTRHMQQEQGLRSKPRQEALKELIVDVLQEEDERRELHLINALPTDVLEFHKDAQELAAKRILVGIAKSYETLKTTAAAPAQELQDRYDDIREKLTMERQAHKETRFQLHASEAQVEQLDLDKRCSSKLLEAYREQNIALVAELSAKDQILGLRQLGEASDGTALKSVV